MVTQPDEFRQAICKVNLRNRDLALAAADVLFTAGRFDEARTRYGEFLRRFPENPEWAGARSCCE